MSDSEETIWDPISSLGRVMPSCSIPPGRLSRKRRRTDRKDFTTFLNTTNPNTYVKFIFLRTSISFCWYNPQPMRNDHSIAGTTILQTTLEDADSTQFYWWLDKSGGKGSSLDFKTFRCSTPSSVGSHERKSRFNLLFLSWLPTDDGVEHRNVLKSKLLPLPPDLSNHQ